MLARALAVSPVPTGEPQIRLSLGSELALAYDEEAVASLLERLLASLIVGVVESPRPAEEQLGSVWCVRWPKAESILVLRRGDGEAVERERAVARGP